MMKHDTKVSVPPGKQGAGVGNTPDAVIKPLGQIKGFGAGKMDSSLKGNDSVSVGSTNGKGQIKGFSGSGVKGAKV
jgi:hypothetical protein